MNLSLQGLSHMVVRPIAGTDIPAATGLLEQLGYPMAETEAARRLDIVQRADGHRVWIAENGRQVLGLLHAFFRPALDKPPEVVVQALVVDGAQRSKGVGEALMKVAEQWARENGSATVSLYSGARRADAHRFYERLGYARTGASNLMRKTLA
jgi:GNAT superfamily N-acetyltransferase